MRNSAKFEVAGAVAALSALVFVIANRADAAGLPRWGPSLPSVYAAQGYLYEYPVSPGNGADLIHVKIRDGHEHTVGLKSFRRDGSVVDNHVEYDVAHGLNAWYDPARVSSVQITLSDRSPVTSQVDGYHCYYEDGHGDLQPATGGSCTPD